MSQIVSWIHFGDFHISGGEDQNYSDFLSLIQEANAMRTGIAFALLPGDNADDGEEDQCALVQEAIRVCHVPVQAIPEDHDMARGDLNLFRTYLSNQVHRSLTIADVHFDFPNGVFNWEPPIFGLGREQMDWLSEDLDTARRNGQFVVVFMYAYPSEHGTDADEVAMLLRKNGVRLVEMGHTHYNELANNGHTVYAATRSTGQIEEGPPGFSIGTIDDGVISWQFKPIGQSPAAVVTSPGGERLIVDPSSPSQLVRGLIPVRARVWGSDIRGVAMSIKGITAPLRATGDGCTWTATLDSRSVPDGSHELEVIAATSTGEVVSDRIRILVNQGGRYKQPARRPVDHQNALGRWSEKHILGTQLGPNENGHAWPSHHDRGHPSR